MLSGSTFLKNISKRITLEIREYLPFVISRLINIKFEIIPINFNQSKYKNFCKYTVTLACPDEMANAERTTLVWYAHLGHMTRVRIISAVTITTTSPLASVSESTNWYWSLLNICISATWSDQPSSEITGVEIQDSDHGKPSYSSLIIIKVLAFEVLNSSSIIIM